MNGHSTLRTLVRHSQLNPIELAWAFCLFFLIDCAQFCKSVCSLGNVLQCAGIAIHVFTLLYGFGFDKTVNLRLFILHLIIDITCPTFDICLNHNLSEGIDGL